MQDVSTYSKNTHPDDPGINAQTHVHEFLGSTQIDILHNHRFAGVTSEAIPLKGGGHIHGIFTNTDFTRNHLHELAAETGPAIPVGKGRHVHLVKHQLR